VWSYTSSPPYLLLEWCLIKHWGSFICSREVRHLSDSHSPATPVVYFCVSPVSPCVARRQCYLSRCCLKPNVVLLPDSHHANCHSPLRPFASLTWPSLWPGLYPNCDVATRPPGLQGRRLPPTLPGRNWFSDRTVEDRVQNHGNTNHELPSMFSSTLLPNSRYARDSVIGSSNPAGCESSFLHNVQTGSGVHDGCSGSFMGVRRPGR